MSGESQLSIDHRRYVLVIIPIMFDIITNDFILSTDTFLNISSHFPTVFFSDRRTRKSVDTMAHSDQHHGVAAKHLSAATGFDYLTSGKQIIEPPERNH